MNISNPLISVIIPVYNCENYLGEAIESVLAQNYNPIEIIIVNDGSTDNTEQVAKHYSDHIKYIFQKNSGIGSARNTGVDISTGDYLAFLDSDDLWVKNKLGRQMGVVNADNSIEIIYGNVTQFFSPELFDELKLKYKCPQEPIAGKFAGTMLIKKENFFKVGKFTAHKSVGVDLDWHLRAKEENMNIKILDDILLERRIHNTNTGILQKNSRNDYIQFLKKSLDRRRKNKTL